MILTPEEAKTKWCPMARVLVVSQDQSSMNREESEDGSFTLPPATLCVAESCMWWRWSEINLDKPRGRCGAAP